MEQWQDAASQQLRLISGRLSELLTRGSGWLRSELGVDLGVKPELIPPWMILLAACCGLLLTVALWASVCRAVLRKRPAVSLVDDGLDGKRGTGKPVKTEEPKKRKKKAEKKAQPNGRAVAEAQEAEEDRAPHQQQQQAPAQTDRVAETKKSKKKAKPAVKETKAATGQRKEPEEGTWETKVSNKEKREQRKKDKNSSDGSASPGGGDTPVNYLPDQPKASATPPASQKKKKGESAKVKAEKAEAVISQGNSNAAPEVAAVATDAAVKVAPQSAAPKTSSWTSQRQTASLWRAGADESWAAPRVSAGELNLLSLTGLGVAQPQPVSDMSWLSQPRVEDEWSGLNGGSADPSSDWNAPSEAWGNFEEPTPEPVQVKELPTPEPTRVHLIEPTEDDEDKDKVDTTTDGAAKSKKKKKKKKTSEEEGALGQAEEPLKVEAPAVSAKKRPPVVESAAAVQPVKASAVEAKAERPLKDVISQKPPVTQVPLKPTDGDPAVKQNNLPAAPQQKKTEESQMPKPAKKKKARRET